MDRRNQDRILIVLVMITVFLITINIFSFVDNTKDKDVSKSTSIIKNTQSVIETEEEVADNIEPTISPEPEVEVPKEEINEEENIIKVSVVSEPQVIADDLETITDEEQLFNVEVVPEKEEDYSYEDVIVVNEETSTSKRNNINIANTTEPVVGIDETDEIEEIYDYEDEIVIYTEPSKKNNTNDKSAESKNSITQNTSTRENKIYFLNVNKRYEGKSNGDCIILESTMNGKKVYAMVDTGRGSQKDVVLQFLNKNNINELEWILITHFHGDHYGALNSIVNQINVKKVYMKEYSGYAGNSDDRNKLTNKWNNLTINYTRLKDIPRLSNDAKDERSLSLGDFSFKVYNVNNVYEQVYKELGLTLNSSDDFCINNAAGDSVKCGENLNSAVVLGKVNDKSILLMGDLGNYPTKFKEFCDNKCSKENKCSATCGTNKEQYTTYIVNKVLKETSKIDIYKAAHHGASGNNPRETLEKLNIQYAIITGGPKNRETNKETVLKTINRFNNLGISNNNIYLTEDGHISVNISSSSINITQ